MIGRRTCETSLGMMHEAWNKREHPACWTQLRTQDSWTRHGMVLNKIQHPLCDHVFILSHSSFNKKWNKCCNAMLFRKSQFPTPRAFPLSTPSHTAFPDAETPLPPLSVSQTQKMSLLGGWKISPRLCSRSHCRREWDFWDEVIEYK